MAPTHGDGCTRESAIAPMGISRGLASVVTLAKSDTARLSLTTLAIIIRKIIELVSPITYERKGQGVTDPAPYFHSKGEVL